MTAQESVQNVLGHLLQQARAAPLDFPYDDLIRVPDLPMEALAKLGTLTRLEEPGDAEILPSLLIERPDGQAQIEVCPFGPLALISSDGQMDTDEVAKVLAAGEITPLFPGNLDNAAPWHGAPLGRWLFPRRLSDALALFDELRDTGR